MYQILAKVTLRVVRLSDGQNGTNETLVYTYNTGYRVICDSVFDELLNIFYPLNEPHAGQRGSL